MSKAIKRWIDLSELPRWDKGEGCGNIGSINWDKSASQKFKVKFRYADIEDKLEIIEYNSKNKKIKIRYNDDDFEIFVGHFKDCKLGRFLKKHTNEFKINIGHINGDVIIIDRKYSVRYDINKNKYNEKLYRYRCKKCGYEGWVVENGAMNNKGCACCSSQVTVQGINDIPTTAPWMVKYFQGGEIEASQYCKSSSKKIKPICPDCGRIKGKSVTISNIYDKHSIGCSCGDGNSYNEKIMESILEQLNIKAIKEYSPFWAKLKRYDYYIEKYNILIEMNGEQHYKNKFTIKSDSTLEIEQQNDMYKEQLAKENGIKHYIQLDCRYSQLEYIKNSILNSELPQLLNFKENDVDWNKCEEFALSNLCKKACEIKRDNPEMTTTEIGSILKLDKTTIIRYLKKGSKIWDWCNYDTKEEKLKNSSRNGKLKGKPVEIFKDEISLGIVFPSCSELERKSKELFGFRLGRCDISNVCNGKKNQYKGFTFEYVETDNTL